MLDRVVREAAGRHPDLLAVAIGDERLTYRELDVESDRVAAGLLGGGLVAGDVVALRLPTGLDYVIAYVGCSKAGVICAGINPSLAEPEQEALVEALSPSLVISDAAPSLDPGLAPHLEPDPQRPVAIVFTSGSTGRPKAAMFRSRQLEAVMRIDLGPDAAARRSTGGPMLAATQLPHVGFMTKLPWYLATGSTIWMLRTWRADDVLRLVSQTAMTTIGGVAPQIALLARSPLADSLDLSCVQQLVVGGAMSSPALVRLARTRFHAGYSIRYSSTESGGVGLATDPAAPDDEVLHTIGRPRPGVEAMVVDDRGDQLPDGEIGELVTRSDAQMDGYWNDAAATAEVIRDGWLHTGDLAARDATGCFRLMGRRREIYIRGGYNVAPAEVEAVLADHPAVADVAVVPRHDDVMGEIGVAVVVPRVGREPPTLDDLRGFAGPRLARWKLPEALLTIDALPLTAMAKLDRAALARLAETEPDAPGRR